MEEVLVPLAFFAFILTLISMRHKHKIDEMRVLRGVDQGVGNDVVSEIRQLRQQVAELRDTTTRYDMSFDAALQRLESRVGHLETQQRALEPQVSVTHNLPGV